MLTPHDPDHGVHNSRTPPEHALIIAILGRAVLDLFGACPASNSDEAENARHEALVFLTASSGGWANRRRELCDVVGIDGDDMRDRVVQILEGASISLAAFDARNTHTNVDKARQCWAHEKAAPTRQQAAREEQARKVKARTGAIGTATPTKPQITRTTVLETLRDGPKTIREIGFALDGELETSSIRQHLEKAALQNLVDRDGPFWGIRPQSALVAAAH